jgi:hypothetical protein
MSDSTASEALQSPEALEKLAAIEHERWAHWQQYMHDSCEKTADGRLIVPAHLVEQWARQIATPYERLTEREKDSDREQVKRYVPTVVELIDNASRRSRH